MSVRDLYAVLGVRRDATAPAIRRAYKELSLRVHPDKQPAGAKRDAAEALFKELSAAYETLSDPDSRALHDVELVRSRQLPTSSVTSSGGTPSASPFTDADFQRRFAEGFARKMRADSDPDAPALDDEDIFDALFGERRANFQPHPPAERPKAPDREISLALTLEELHAGCVKRRRLTRSACSPENGDMRRVATILRIDVRPGYRPGDKVRFRDAGDETPALRAPDVVFVIAQSDHPRFTRRGDDLHCSLAVPLGDALTGVSATLAGIDGAPVTVATDAVVKPGATLVMRGAGLSRRGRTETRGDLVVTFNVKFPERLFPAERRALRDVFNKIDAKAARAPMRRSASMFSGPRVVSDSDESVSAAAAREPRSTGNAAFRSAPPTRTPTCSSSQGSAQSSSHTQSRTTARAAAQATANATVHATTQAAEQATTPPPDRVTSSHRTTRQNAAIHVFKRTGSRSSRKESEVDSAGRSVREPHSKSKSRSKGWLNMFR